MYDIIIIGSGPAGLTAAIYASRAQLTAVVLEKDYLGSGQIAVSEQVDNYPGLPGIDGYTLGEKFREHAEQLGAKFENVEVDHIKQTADGFTVFCKDSPLPYFSTRKKTSSVSRRGFCLKNCVIKPSWRSRSAE